MLSIPYTEEPAWPLASCAVYRGLPFAGSSCLSQSIVLFAGFRVSMSLSLLLFCVSLHLGVWPAL